MLLLNIHTHRPLPPGEATVSSAGLHPWDVGEDWQQRLDSLHDDIMHADAIGECGLDRARPATFQLQHSAFEAQIALSEALRKPIILHCVRSTDDILRLKCGTTLPWIWHGFRGKPQQLQTLLRHGFYVSFGLRHNDDSLAQCPAERLFLETDDTPAHIDNLYERAATLRHTSINDLRTRVWDNAKAVFGEI